METRNDISTLSEEQLRELVGRLSAKLGQMERRMGKLKQMMGDMADSVSDREMECEDRFHEKEANLIRDLRAAKEEAAMWQAKYREMERRALVAEARLEEKEHAQPMTIIYGNNATPMYGGIINRQDNSTNHKSKNEMNNPTINNYGGNNQVGDGNTMNVHSAQQQETLLTPTQERAREALITLSTEGRWEKQQWWAVWKVMMSLHLVNKSAREFADYLVDLGVTPDNVYNNIYKLDAEFRNISAVNATEWQQYNGKYGDKYQKQIDTASRLLALFSE